MFGLQFCKPFEKMEKLKSTVPLTAKKVSNHIPDDFTFSILSKLPLKSLIRFKCVRKSWSLLFENPYFMNMYRVNFASNKNYSYVDNSCLALDSLETDILRQAMFSLYGEKFENKVKLDWPPPIQDNEGLYILDSIADGTICFYQGLALPKITIWNVTTKEFKVRPPSPLESPPPSYERVMFSLHGFGYDHVRNDLKVIRHAAHCMPLTDFENETCISLPPHDSIWEVYSLRSNSWEKLDVDIPTGYYPSGIGIHTNGVCHWWDGFDDCMVSFDLTSDIFFRTPLPSYVHDYFGFVLVDRRLVTLNGSVAFISSYENKSTSFHISILGELGVKESWTKLFVVGPLDCVDYPIGGGNKGDIFFISNDGELVRFDLSKQMIENYCIQDAFCITILLHKEVLLPVGGIKSVKADDTDY